MKKLQRLVPLQNGLYDIVERGYKYFSFILWSVHSSVRTFKKALVMKTHVSELYRNNQNDSLPLATPIYWKVHFSLFYVYYNDISSENTELESKSVQSKLFSPRLGEDDVNLGREKLSHQVPVLWATTLLENIEKIPASVSLRTHVLVFVDEKLIELVSIFRF